MSYNTGTNKELLYTNLVPGILRASFTAETPLNDVATMGVPPQIPAKWWQPGGGGQNNVGKGIGIIARGQLSTTTTGPTFWPQIRLGTSPGSTTGPIILGTTAASPMAVSVTAANGAFEIMGEIFMKTLGGAGPNSTLVGMGRILNWGATNYWQTMWGNDANPGTVGGVDWSVDQYISVNIACGTSNAANTAQLYQLLVYGLN